MSSQPVVQLTDQDKALAKKIGFDEAVLLLVKEITKGNIEQLKNNVFDAYPRRIVYLSGISVVVNESEIESCLDLIRDKLPSIYLAAVVGNYNENGLNLPSSIAVIKSSDRYEFLRIRNTNGSNYEIYTENIIEKLKAWEKRFSFDLQQVGRDFIYLKFRTLPDPICNFAEEVYEFCPDSVDQGVSLAYDIHEDRNVYEQARRLCKGTSFKSKHDNETIQGIQLLAYEIEKTKYLGLWWD